jgi:hypothetical protein
MLIPNAARNRPCARQLQRIFRRQIAGILAVLFVMAVSTSGVYGQGPTTEDHARTPILLELFTSEGCSSCPPADQVVQQLNASQPVPDAYLIVLSEHVDYWNHDGWKDPYSSPSMTDRQIAYVRALGLKEPYTPQIIVDGTGILQGSEQQMLQSLQKSAAAPDPVSIHLDSVSIDSKGSPDVRGHIEIPASQQKKDADVYVALVLGHAESQVLSGENSGKHLTYVDVVQEIKKVGKLSKDKSFAQTFQIKLKPGTDPGNVRIVAFVQEPGPGQVLGAALWKAN